MKSKRRMPQEGSIVAEKGFLEDSRIGGFFRRKDRTKSEQTPLDRILEDFPWLWAVNSCWTSRYDVPRVSQEMFDLRVFLGAPTDAHGDFGLWIALAEDGRVWDVMRIDPRGKDTCWAQEILRVLACGSPRYVVMKRGSEIWIYRHPEGSRAMERLIEDIAAFFRSTHPEAPHVGRDLSGLMD